MSKLLASLAPSLDQPTLAYITEAVRVSDATQALQIAELKNQIAALTNANTVLSNRISELEGLQAVSNGDDKYALTKAKLVRVMKENGWYD